MAQTTPHPSESIACPFCSEDLSQFFTENALNEAHVCPGCNAEISFEFEDGLADEERDATDRGLIYLYHGPIAHLADDEDQPQEKQQALYVCAKAPMP